MSDLIDRREAIKAIEDMQDCYNGFSDTYDKACIIGVLEEVPSAQPNLQPTCNQLATDCISRQAAIDAVNEITSEYVPLLWGELERIPLEVAISIKRLPSAQPEYSTDEWCTDCKEYDHERHCCPRWNRVIRTILQEAQLTGRWIVVDSDAAIYRYCCSNCNAHHRARYDFCPSCGAKMEVEE